MSHAITYIFYYARVKKGEIMTRDAKKINHVIVQILVLSMMTVVSMEVLSEYGRINDHLENVIEDISSARSPGITLVKDFLVEAQKELNRPSGNLPGLLEKLQTIKEFALKPEYKKENITSKIYGTISLEQFANIVLGQLIDKVQATIQKPVARPVTPVAPKVLARPLPAIPKTPNITKAIPGEPHGLVNFEQRNPKTGNRCFMNAAIQCLFGLDRLTDMLVQNAESYRPNTIAQSYIKLIQKLKTSQEAEVNPLEFCVQGWKMMGESQGTPQDAAEFVQLLLTGLIGADAKSDFVSIKNVDTIASLVTFSVKSTVIRGLENTTIRDIGNFYPELYDVLQNNPALGSLKISQLIKECPTLSALEKRYPGLVYVANQNPDILQFVNRRPKITQETILSLPIDETDKTLINCMEGFFESTTIGSGIQTIKKLSQLERTGKYFIISLRRKIYNPENKIFIKKGIPISFELENMNINPFSDKSLPKYRLKGVVIHAGDPQGGHYTSYVRVGNSWYFCNDTAISAVSLQEMAKIAQQGYGSDRKQTPVLFFYESQ